MGKRQMHIDPCCANCAFLCKLRYRESIELSSDERERVKVGDGSFLKTVVGIYVTDAEKQLSCYKAQLPTSPKYLGNIWKHGKILIGIQDLAKKRCEFFYPYTECVGIKMDAVEKKQSHNMEIENVAVARRAVKIARIGIVISVLALAASLMLGIIALLFR